MQLTLSFFEECINSWLPENINNKTLEPIVQPIAHISYFRSIVCNEVRLPLMFNGSLLCGWGSTPGEISSFLKHGLITALHVFWSACKIPNGSQFKYYKISKRVLKPRPLLNKRSMWEWVRLVQWLRLLTLISLDGVQFPAKAAVFSVLSLYFTCSDQHASWVTHD